MHATPAILYLVAEAASTFAQEIALGSDVTT